MKKTIFKLFLALILILGNIRNASAQTKTVSTPKILYGYVDPQGKSVIVPRYDDAKDFSDGLAAVKIGDKYGFIDRTGTLVIEPQFEDAGAFSEGLAPAQKGDLWGYIDLKGNWKIKPQFANADSFSEGFASVNAGSNCQFIDLQGKVVFEVGETDDWPRFHDGKAVVVGEWRGQPPCTGVEMLDKKGKTIFNAAICRSPYTGMVDFAQDNEVRGDDPSYASYVLKMLNPGRPFLEDGLQGTLVEGLAVKRSGEKYGYVDSKDQWVIQPQFTDAQDFSGGLAFVQLGEKNAYIDKSGKITIGPGIFSKFHEGLAVSIVITK